MSEGNGAMKQSLIPDLRDEKTRGAVKGLLFYSLTVIAVPLGSMFLLKWFLFEALLGYSSGDSSLYSAIVAVILVHAVLFLWVREAFFGEEDKAKIGKKD